MYNFLFESKVGVRFFDEMGKGKNDKDMTLQKWSHQRSSRFWMVDKNNKQAFGSNLGSLVATYLSML